MTKDQLVQFSQLVIAMVREEIDDSILATIEATDSGSPFSRGFFKAMELAEDWADE